MELFSSNKSNFDIGFFILDNYLPFLHLEIVDKNVKNIDKTCNYLYKAYKTCSFHKVLNGLKVFLNKLL